MGDLKIANAALAEMAEAFRVFRPYRHIRKITMFGSARTKPDDPIYILARDLAAKLAAADWMVVTGAGPASWPPGWRGRGGSTPSGSTSACPSRATPTPSSRRTPSWSRCGTSSPASSC